MALGGFDAAWLGAHWVGCELEAKFVRLGKENIAAWKARYGHVAGYGRARLIQGDSRRLTEVVGEAAGLCVSSPPFEEAPTGGGIAKVGHSTDPAMKDRQYTPNNQGVTSGNLASGSDFWSAAATIVQQVYAVLAPGSHAIFVVKGFIRKRAYVDFPDQWRRLCESVGFLTLHLHRAWLVERGNTQPNMLGEPTIDYTRERKSFFRRLAEKKGSPRIDYEVVLCIERLRV